ncbi:hypothetical protein CONPUDRAFT_155592 [Coniophora puteana RWD-64-598 SS2]|uniref:Uncharacterized protein n=1 Tax=Coniophora puteana (strain RWD-64-598) TaxID=741705 RepID=A0A5M3MIL0_CONPW|nr:uncharacterized protein CONPUDRAFT_155592 [Coniophora puteana RWD-64-598 SS2]EIW78887.1 hypothetical protein CONPUDRAFT_155592 [Coniophora puteana RWD-64-598 SS2]
MSNTPKRATLENTKGGTDAPSGDYRKKLPPAPVSFRRTDLLVWLDGDPDHGGKKLIAYPKQRLRTFASLP